MNVMHPPFVHFVIALPLVALFSQFTYMVTKDPAYSKAAFRIIAFAMLVSLFAVFSGINDAKKIIKNHNIMQDGLTVLNSHKLLGFGVLALLLLTTLSKWLALSKRSVAWENFSIVLIIITLMASLYQGRSGGSIVYQYTGGIDSQTIQQRLEERKK